MRAAVVSIAAGLAMLLLAGTACTQESSSHQRASTPGRVASPISVPLDAPSRATLQRHTLLAPANGRILHCEGVALTALLQASGAMPDGILLVEGAELKYINQVPHTDHCVWLPVCLQAYLDEAGDDALLDEPVVGRDGRGASVAERIDQAMHWLLRQRDDRGLSFIAQGDWCDPMNMVGWQGRGVSGWLSLASAHALGLWADICARRGRAAEAAEARRRDGRRPRPRGRSYPAGTNRRA